MNDWRGPVAFGTQSVENSNPSTMAPKHNPQEEKAESRGLTFQDMILDLSRFWADQGCVLALPYDVEVGAGTMCPETFLRVLGRDPWRVAYVQPSRHPADGRYGENPNRLLKHTQMQVILKPPPPDIQDVYLASLERLGIDLRHHDIRLHLQPLGLLRILHEVVGALRSPALAYPRRVAGWLARHWIGPLP